MKRRNFIRDCLMGLAISLVPKILQPILPEVLEEEMVEARISYFHYYNIEEGRYIADDEVDKRNTSIMIPKRMVEQYRQHFKK